MPAKRKSTVWLHFDQVEGNKGICRYCFSRLSCAGGSTGNLTRHIKKKHPDINQSSTSLVGESMDHDYPIQVEVDLIAVDESDVAESMEVKKHKRKINNNRVDMDNNNDLQFFKSLIPYMADFSAIQKLRIRSKIQQIILTEHEQASTTSNYSETSGNSLPNLSGGEKLNHTELNSSSQAEANTNWEL
ncbi:uncharacterized protein LOC111045565 isoform X2 [Nilaparvata lugens]|uniref:uncharacterized protein LOC111045565 isoform X2 n=1 Tax=Nilaparvata lugens TaxID=108931 RepID=UPI00193D5EDB|nr:uncharacterized protein LOC111045565 isoform X2 [Nilaparvata lugens]